MGKLIYGDLDLCGWCVMKYQNMNNNKSIYRCLYDLQKNHREEYMNGNIDWVPLCIDVQRQTLFDGIFAGDRFFL